MSLDNSDKTVKATRVFAYRTDGRRYTAGHRVETEIHAMNGSYPCSAGSRRVPAMVHSESEVFSKKIAHEPVPGLPQGYHRVESTVQKAWYRGDLNTWEARWDYTHDIAYRTPHVVSLYFSTSLPPAGEEFNQTKTPGDKSPEQVTETPGVA